LIPPLAPREKLAFAALGFILAVTAAWWALALWPVADQVPAWLARTRAVCFGSAPDGLPNAAGWLLLIGEPIAMLVTLLIIGGDVVTSSLRTLGSHRGGRGALSALGLLLAAGMVAAGARVARASARSMGAQAPTDEASLAVRLDGPAPQFGLVDQRGRTVTLEQMRGRVVVVGFAYAHCETVCPVVVREVLRARSLLAEQPLAVILITLDPWRDTPSRLPAIAENWKLGTEEFVVSGSVREVEQVLDSWGVSRSRNTDTGLITHATPVYVVRADGRLGFRVGPSAEQIVAAVRTAETT
jgi:protein SCO1/2